MQQSKPTHFPGDGRLLSWFDVRGKRTGSWAFALNRLTALALTLYLFLHLFILRLLLQGASGWDNFVALARSPYFLALDVVLIFGLLFHSLNGIRLALVGRGIGATRHRSIFWLLMTIGVVLLLISGWRIFTI